MYIYFIQVPFLEVFAQKLCVYSSFNILRNCLAQRSSLHLKILKLLGEKYSSRQALGIGF